MKGKFLGFGLALLATATIGLVQLQVRAADDSRDCDKFAVIRCGTMTAAELRAEYDTNNGSPMNGDTTKQPDIKKVFTGMGISATDLDGSFKAGTVYRDGTVKVNGSVVATNAKMAARNLGGTPIAGTNADKISVSAMASAQTALVKMDQSGKFLFAVMKPCGNAVTATPKETPAPTPTPTPTPTPAPSIDVIKYVGNNSKYERVGVNVEFSYRIDVKNTGNVDLDNVLVTDTPDRAITLISVSPPTGKIENNTFMYTIPKLLKGETRTFTLTAKVPAYMAGRLINTVCVDTPTIPGSPDKCDKAEVDVPPKTEQPPTPEQPTVTPTELPQTGPTDVVLQIVGAMSLVGASAYYIASRRTA
jgi:uncharacterized repeat protein (TIGR01451 family)